jgi:hypothetical protein
MIKKSYLRLYRALSVTLLFGCIVSSQWQVLAGDCKLKAQLIWGTDEEKPDDPNLREVDSKLADKLRRVFKWKNYFEVTNQNITLTPAGKTFSMSPKCKIELKKIEGDSKKGEEPIIEVKFYGEGKLVTTKRQPIKLLQRGEYSIFAGDDKEKNGNAWFVVLSLAES